MLLFLTAAGGFWACSEIKDAPNVADSRKEITAFRLIGSDGDIDQSGKNITIIVPKNQTLTGLTAEVTYTGASIYPAPDEPADYGEEVAFTVTAADGSTEVYTVQVLEDDETNKLITAFTLSGITGAVTAINHANGTITVTVPQTVTQTIFTPDIVHSGVKYAPIGPVNFVSPVVFTVTARDESKKTYQVTVKRAPSTENTIEEFFLLGHEGVIDQQGQTITVDLPASYMSSITSVVPDVILHTGASISPPAATARDFSVPVSYIVTSKSGSQKTYTVNVAIAGIDSADILVFRLEGVLAKITGTEITVTVPYETDLTEPLLPIISHNGASFAIDPAPDLDGRVEFGGNVTITITAANGTTKVYTIIVTQALCPYKTITDFIMQYAGGQSVGFISNNSNIPESQGNITGSTITVIVPNGTDCTSLTPAITAPGARSISPASGVARNFEDPVTYLVTAEDGTTHVYTVHVMPSDLTSKSILNFVLPGQLNIAPMIVDGAGSAAGEITVLMPMGALLTSLTPTTIIHTGKSVLNADVAQNFGNTNNPAYYTVEAGDGTTKTYTVRITYPVLPPLTAGSHAGYAVTSSGSMHNDGGGMGTNIYSLFDNNLDTYVCYNSTGVITATWSGVQTVNRIRVILSHHTSRVAVELRDSTDKWVPVVPSTPLQLGEFVQTIPEYTGVTGVRVTMSQAIKDLRPRVKEFIIENVQ
ncbi:MAG: DUF5018 domain-containing protein [Spirochaetaceae bacterium]|jgi:hypothetical protein|nr:DUF5018 domain-containing protein [Spirochaetaceae bacterium]